MQLRNGKKTEDLIDKHSKHQVFYYNERRGFFGGKVSKEVCKECGHAWPCSEFMHNADALFYAIKELTDEIEYKQRKREQSETERALLNAALGGIANIVRVYYRDDGSDLRPQEDYNDYDM